MCVTPFLILSFLIGDAITRIDLDSRNRIGESKNRKQEGTAGLITLIIFHSREPGAPLLEVLNGKQKTGWATALLPDHEDL